MNRTNEIPSAVASVDNYSGLGHHPEGTRGFGIFSYSHGGVIVGKSYYEKLRDPRWQKKRLEIMERDGFACRDCGNGADTLNVHHAYYEKGVDPWEYPGESMKTLCETCHNHLTQVKKYVDCALVQLPPMAFSSVVLLIDALTHIPEEYRDWVCELDAEDVATSLLVLARLDWKLRSRLTSAQHVARLAEYHGYVKRDEVANG